MLDLLSPPRHPIPGSFYIHWAKEDKSFWLTFQNFCQNDNIEKLYFAFDSAIKIAKSYIIQKTA